MLLPLDQGLFFKKSDSKKNLVIFPSTRHGKIIFALLDEIIAVYMKLSLIYIKGSNFEVFFSGIVVIVLDWGF